MYKLMDNNNIVDEIGQVTFICPVCKDIYEIHTKVGFSFLEGTTPGIFIRPFDLIHGECLNGHGECERVDNAISTIVLELLNRGCVLDFNRTCEAHYYLDEYTKSCHHIDNMCITMEYNKAAYELIQRGTPKGWKFSGCARYIRGRNVVRFLVLEPEQCMKCMTSLEEFNKKKEELIKNLKWYLECIEPVEEDEHTGPDIHIWDQLPRYKYGPSAYYGWSPVLGGNLYDSCTPEIKNK